MTPGPGARTDRDLLASLNHPSIYVIDAAGIDARTRHELRRLGT